MKKILAVVLAALLATPIAAQDAKPLTVEQCNAIYNGLRGLDWAGKQINDDPTKRPPDAKQYKLGDARLTIAMNIAALEPVMLAYQRSQQGFLAEQPVIPQVPEGKPAPPDVQQMAADQNKAFQAHQLADLAKPCPATPGHVKLSDLKLGDGPDQNAIPPSVLAAFSLIVDR